jgi:hypothetical protein
MCALTVVLKTTVDVETVALYYLVTMEHTGT